MPYQAIQAPLCLTNTDICLELCLEATVLTYRCTLATNANRLGLLANISGFARYLVGIAMMELHIICTEYDYQRINECLTKPEVLLTSRR